ncbi:juvenile hormone esterase-like [Sitodiplosis mosellana]|uniref:juvenile hormone esterase-like n=1 Tax=Sitodiplosis mosellana TaxID=263140 RepID=UPI0024446116|nr:juvenile hormone esterase-like [Sitodiplosis mosellana]
MQQTNLTFSEDCLYLNIYTPVLQRVKVTKKLNVIFFIHGGAFTEGDGSDLYYGPDFLMEDNVVLVTINYRLGPFGFANFDRYGYTGNMGFKDQREALKWVKMNIIYFGGDPDAISLLGESSGAASVHLHLLGASCEYINRAIMLSGSAVHYWAHYQPNNHLNLLREIFKDDLGEQTSDEDVFNFMMNAPMDVIVEKTPPFETPNGLFALFWAAVIEDEDKAIKPFLTRRPHDIYATKSLSHHCKCVEVMFGVTSAEFAIVTDPTNLYGWIEPVKSHALIGLPYHGLTLTPNDEEYQAFQTEIFDYYFGKEEIEKTTERLNQYLQMGSDINFIVAFYEAIELHAEISPTFCYHFNISLNTNVIKVPRQLNVVEGAIHVDDIGYIFKSEEFSDLYDQTMINRRFNVRNQQTINAWQFVSGLFTDFTKYGSLRNVQQIKSTKNVKCVDITNTGLGVTAIPRKTTMNELWLKIKRRVQPRIVDEF